jgi:hypothetical protein
MNALAELKNLPFTKMEQQDFVNQAVDEILAGNIDPLLADLKLKAMEETITSIRKDLRVKNVVIEEAEKWGKTFPFHGAEITVSQKTTKDYTGIDPVLDDLYKQQELLKATIKARELTVSAGVDPSTGETFAPPKTSTTQFLTYRFK